MGDRRVLVGFARWDNWWAKIVQKITGSQWTHTWLEYEDETWGGWLCVHASNNGVEITTREGVAEDRISHKLLRYECLLADEMLSALRRHKGVLNYKYDYKSLVLNLGILCLQKIFPSKAWKPALNPKKMTCSEFVAMIMQSAGVPNTVDWVPETWSPGALEKFCRGSRAFRFHSVEEF